MFSAWACCSGPWACIAGVRVADRLSLGDEAVVRHHAPQEDQHDDPEDHPERDHVFSSRMPPATAGAGGFYPPPVTRNARPSPARSTWMRLPSTSSPLSTFEARGSWTSRWISRFNGRAPKLGS